MKINLPGYHIRAELGDVDKEARTVEVIWATGMKGIRNDWERGPYFEELSMDKSHVDMERLNAGTAPVLAVHDRDSLDAVIGVVERAWLENGQGKAILRFSESDPVADKTFRKIKEKILRNVSVGYSVSEMVRQPERKGDEYPTYLVTKWQPQEISVVPIGFDHKAVTRNNTKSFEATVIETSQEGNMNLKANEALAERTRIQAITKAVRTAELDVAVADDLIERDLSVEQARAEIFKKLEEKSDKTKVRNIVNVEMGLNEQDKKRQGFIEHLGNRIDPTFKPQDASSQLFQGRSLIGSCEIFYGRKLGESNSQFATRVMSTSDLPFILSGGAEKALQNRYSLQPATWRKFCRTSELRDFKTNSLMKAGDYPSLAERNEGAEYTYGSFGEEREQVSLREFGKIVSVTNRVIINDDLSALANLATQGAVAASRLESKLVFDLMMANPTMSDSIALWHASHGNLPSAAAISDTSLNAAIKLLRSQKTVDKTDYIDASGKFLICGLDKELEAKKALAAVNAATTANVNVYADALELIVDPRVTGNKWFVFADPSLIEGISVYFLEGRQTPQIQTRVNFETESIDMKTSHICAVGAMEYRSSVYNAGA